MSIQDHNAASGRYRSQLDEAFASLRAQKIIPRIWRRDHTVWKPDPTEIANRLGWLYSPEAMQESVPEIDACVEAVRAEGFTQALLLGMGGSSLAPEVFRLTFGVRPGYLDLAVLDSTHPAAVLAQARRLDLKTTLFVVSTKSGGTVETFSFFKFFYNLVLGAVGQERAGAHFIAITDPGSGLADTASKHKFRQTFLNDPDIGGRYSALSYFGLVPAALLGIDLNRLLERTRMMVNNSQSENLSAGGENTGVWWGTIMGELALAGRDKVTLFASPALSAFGAWAEQLIAESTGKEGKGILPVANEEPGPPAAYANDRLFIHLRLAGDTTHDAKIKALAAAGHPVVELKMADTYELGAEFFRWEIATIVAGQRLGINPFDQPNVESAKVLARKMVAEYQEKGRLPELQPTVREHGMAAFSQAPAASLSEALQDFLAQAPTGAHMPRSYVALQAFIAPEAATDEALKILANAIRDRHQLAATIGYGPRFLHSTGQLHKGDAGNGLFIQFTADLAEDAAIPNHAGEDASNMTFGTLVSAQALGDRQALLDNQRKAIRFDLGKDAAASLLKLAEWV